MTAAEWIAKHRPPGHRLLASSLGTLGLTIVLGAACAGGNVGIDITLPADLSSSARWFEVAAYKGAKCESIAPMLTNGVPEGATARVAWSSADTAGPMLGDIPSGQYAFGAVARDENCTVIATGCKEQDVDSDNVSIALEAATRPSGQCSVGASCQAGMCVPSTNNSDPSVGAGCSLELLGSGPLPAPILGSGTLMSAPVVAATTTGFLIAYRQVDEAGVSARLVLLPIDQAGGVPLSRTGVRTEDIEQMFVAPELPDRCRTTDETDGLGLIVSGEDARLTIARPSCGAKPALELLNLKTTSETEPGRPVTGKFIISSSPNDIRVMLSPARSAAGRPGGDLVVFTEGGVARIANVNPEKGIVGPNGSFGGTTGITNAWVAANDRILALLAAGPPRTLPPPAPGDAGADGGADGGTAEGPADTQGAAELRLLVLEASTAIDSISAEKRTPRAPITFAGTWGSLATLGGRALVLSGNPPNQGGSAVDVRAYDLNDDSLADSTQFFLTNERAVTAGDITARGNRAYFAVLQQQEIALYVYDNATTNLTALRDVSFTRLPRISAISTIRDGRVAVAATDSRVAVVWTTASVLGQYDNPGGYAVFACTQ